MTGAVEVPLIVVGAAVVNLIAVGAAWGNLSAGQKQTKADICDIKAALGLNGKGDGLYVRRDEMEFRVEKADENHADYERRITALENRRGS